MTTEALCSSHQAACFFIKIADRSKTQITAMKVQKLLYLSQGYHLAIYGQPLLTNEGILAFRYGPVCPAIRSAFAIHGSKPIDASSAAEWTLPIDVSSAVEWTLLSSFKKELLERIWATHGHLADNQLSRIATEENGPWHQTVTKYGMNAEALIFDSVMTEFFSKKLEGNEKRKSVKPVSADRLISILADLKASKNMGMSQSIRKGVGLLHIAIKEADQGRRLVFVDKNDKIAAEVSLQSLIQ